MTFGWKQIPTGERGIQKWVLTDKRTGWAVMVIKLAERAEHRQNFKVLRKIQLAYEFYYGLIEITKGGIY